MAIAATVPSASSAAVPEAAVRGSSARRIAAGTSPGTGSTISASAWPGRSPHESLPPRGFWGLPPGRIRTRPARRSAAGAMSVDSAGGRASARDGTGAGGALPLLPGSAGVPPACAQSAQRRQRRCRRDAGAPGEAFPWTQRRDVSKQLSLLVVAADFFTYSSAEAPAQQPHRGDRARCSRLPRGGDGYPPARSRRLRSSRLARDRRRRGRVSRSAPEKFGATPGARRLRSTACPVRRVRSFLFRGLRGGPASRRRGGGRSQRSPGSFRNRRLSWTREAIGGRLVARLRARFL